MMLDYNLMAITRMEYEERIRQIEMLQRMREGRPAPRNSAMRRALFGLGSALVTLGGRLKAQYEPMPQSPTMAAGSHAR